MKPYSEKISDTIEIPLSDMQWLQFFLVMLNVMQQYILHIHPWGNYSKRTRHFTWMTAQTQHSRKLKSLIPKALSIPLQYFQHDLIVTIPAVASKVGLGACLLQNGKPIDFASKAFDMLRPGVWIPNGNYQMLCTHTFISIPAFLATLSQWRLTTNLLKWLALRF